jgi:hypothetical protein
MEIPHDMFGEVVERRESNIVLIRYEYADNVKA